MLILQLIEPIGMNGGDIDMFWEGFAFRFWERNEHKGVWINCVVDRSAHMTFLILPGWHEEPITTRFEAGERGTDDAVQRDVHSMIYHLYSFIRAGTGHSIPPMGLSGGTGDYLGHIFWDTETWMFPTLLALQPELARMTSDSQQLDQSLPILKRADFLLEKIREKCP